MENWALGLTILVMFIGLAGVVLPVLPGIPLIFLAALGYGIYDNFVSFPVLSVIILLIPTVISFFIEHVAGLVGAKYCGSSRLGIVGSIIGAFVGLFFLPFGLIIGPLFGAVAGEMVAGKQPKDAMKVGLGTILGMVGGTVIKIAIGLLMMIYFLWEVLRH